MRVWRTDDVGQLYWFRNELSDECPDCRKKMDLTFFVHHRLRGSDGTEPIQVQKTCPDCTLKFRDRDVRGESTKYALFINLERPMFVEAKLKLAELFQGSNYKSAEVYRRVTSLWYWICEQIREKFGDDPFDSGLDEAREA